MPVERISAPAIHSGQRAPARSASFSRRARSSVGARVGGGPRAPRRDCWRSAVGSRAGGLELLAQALGLGLELGDARRGRRVADEVARRDPAAAAVGAPHARPLARRGRPPRVARRARRCRAPVGRGRRQLAGSAARRAPRPPRRRRPAPRAGRARSRRPRRGGEGARGSSCERSIVARPRARHQGLGIPSPARARSAGAQAASLRLRRAQPAADRGRSPAAEREPRARRESALDREGGALRPRERRGKLARRGGAHTARASARDAGGDGTAPHRPRRPPASSRAAQKAAEGAPRAASQPSSSSSMPTWDEARALPRGSPAASRARVPRRRAPRTRVQHGMRRRRAMEPQAQGERPSARRRDAQPARRGEVREHRTEQAGGIARGALREDGVGVPVQRSPRRARRFPPRRRGSPGRTRTCDPAVNSRLLYQLSYRGTEAGF